MIRPLRHLAAALPAALVFALLAGCSGGDDPSPQTPALPGTPVGPEGGVVERGGARLVIPAGALATTVRISLEPARAAARLDPLLVDGTAIAVLPVATAFSTPATLTLAYDQAGRPSGTAEEELRLHAVTAEAWTPIASSAVDTTARRASGPIGGAGTYGVRWPGPSAPCSLPEDRQFDFWVGRWSFSAPGAFPGTDDVTIDATGCLLEELFVDSAGTRGRSVSLYSRLDGQWHQTYVDSQGGRIAMSGRLEGSRMVLYQTPALRYFWEPIAAGGVRFGAEQAANASWGVVFDSTYAPR